MLQKDVMHPNNDDRVYVQRVLQRIPVPEQRLICGAYNQAWVDAYNAEPIEHKKDNAGRFAANTLIRKLARQYMEKGSTGIPRICGNCDHCQSWQGQYHCSKFKQEIPVEYVNQENECEQYENAIPF